MHEVFAHPEDVPTWRAAIRGDEPDWRTFPPNCVATLDWPAAEFWGELSDAHPDAVVVLSTRASARAPRDAGRPAPRVEGGRRLGAALHRARFARAR
jgi:hypothetical protein